MTDAYDDTDTECGIADPASACGECAACRDDSADWADHRGHTNADAAATDDRAQDRDAQ